MHTFTSPLLSSPLLLAFSGLWAFISVSASGIDPFPVPYSSSFVEPQPPLIQAEFTANYMQQKYNSEGVNNIIAGFVYFSPSSNKVRADGASNSTLQSSLFDFGNVSAQGEVSNKLFTFAGGVKQSQGSCSFSEFVAPGFPLFAPDILNTTQAVYIGVRNDELYGPLNAWQFLFSMASGDLVTMYLDANSTMVRFDVSAPGLRTFITNRFFNIVFGTVAPVTFETDCT